MKEDISWLRGQQILLGAFKLEKISLLDIPDEFPVNGSCLWTQLCAKSERTKVIRQFTQHWPLSAGRVVDVYLPQLNIILKKPLTRKIAN